MLSSSDHLVEDSTYYMGQFTTESDQQDCSSFTTRLRSVYVTVKTCANSDFVKCWG